MAELERVLGPEMRRNGGCLRLALSWKDSAVKVAEIVEREVPEVEALDT